MNHLLKQVNRHCRNARTLSPLSIDGRITELRGLVIEATAHGATLGDTCEIIIERGAPIRAEVVGFRDSKVWLMPLGDTHGIAPGSRVRICRESFRLQVGQQLLGRVLNGLGEPIDNLGPLQGEEWQLLDNPAPKAMSRPPIRDHITTGIRAIDGLLTLATGQRVGIFAGSGVGKSVLLGMTARYTSADINVIGLIGERGREVREFIDNDLGPEGLARSVIIAATSDQPATVRLKGAMAATAIAEYFRDQGKSVLLMLDSLTRVAMAQREIGLAIGEPPTAKGYTPSVFAMLPQLLERAGNSEKGSITGLYTVLVEGDDLDDPISDSATLHPRRPYCFVADPCQRGALSGYRCLAKY